jgi:hypothetical protein
MLVSARRQTPQFSPKRLGRIEWSPWPSIHGTFRRASVLVNQKARPLRLCMQIQCSPYISLPLPFLPVLKRLVVVEPTSESCLSKTPIRSQLTLTSPHFCAARSTIRQPISRNSPFGWSAAQSGKTSRARFHMPLLQNTPPSYRYVTS